MNRDSFGNWGGIILGESEKERHLPVKMVGDFVSPVDRNQRLLIVVVVVGVVVSSRRCPLIAHFELKEDGILNEEKHSS